MICKYCGRFFSDFQTTLIVSLSYVYVYVRLQHCAQYVDVMFC